MQKASEELIIFLLINILVIVSIASMTLMIIFIHRKKQLKAKILFDELKNEYDQELLKTKLEIQEQTAHDIAREIHDSIGHDLTLAKLQLNTVISQKNDLDLDIVDQSINLISNSIIQLSDISKNLNAEALLQHGLLPAIDEEINRLRSLKEFQLQYEVNGFTKYFEPHRELVIYRIIQEGFQNIIKHSKAHTASLLIHFHSDHINVSLVDDGVGFNQAEAKTTRSTGLVNMENRIRFLDGQFNIFSQPNRGTQIKFKIPYFSNEKRN